MVSILYHWPGTFMCHKKSNTFKDMFIEKKDNTKTNRDDYGLTCPQF